MFFKKGEIHWEQLGKLLLALIILVILIIIVGLFRDKILDLWDKLGNIILFGG